MFSSESDDDKQLKDNQINSSQINDQNMHFQTGKLNFD